MFVVPLGTVTVTWSQNSPAASCFQDLWLILMSRSRHKNYRSRFYFAVSSRGSPCRCASPCVSQDWCESMRLCVLTQALQLWMLLMSCSYLLVNVHKHDQDLARTTCEILCSKDNTTTVKRGFWWSLGICIPAKNYLILSRHLSSESPTLVPEIFFLTHAVGCFRSAKPTC